MLFSRAAGPLFFFSVVTNTLLLVAPLHMTQVYNRVLSSGSETTLLYITLIAIGLLAIYGFCEAVRGRLAQRLSAAYAVRHGEQVFRVISGGKLPSSKSNELVQNFGTVRTFVASRAYVGLYDVPFAPLFLGLLYIMNVQIGLITTLGIAVLIVFAWLNKKLTTDIQSKTQQANADAVGFVAGVISRSEEVKAMGLMADLQQRWGKKFARSLAAQDASTAINAGFYGLSKAVRQILQISTMAWGALLVLEGDMSGGVIFAASLISGRTLQPLEQIIGGWDGIFKAKAAHEAVLAAIHGLKDEKEHVEQPEPAGRLEAVGLSYEVDSSKGRRPLLKDVNFTLEPGDLLAVIGKSGAGKSTLARILSGALEPTAGEVTLDGCKRENWRAEQWGKYVGYVPQDISLFPGTIGENIARMALAVDEEKLIRAATIAGVHDIINSLPDSYMTPVGPGGVQLSGGQRQRIALARALYSEPRILILDEPNSHLDEAGEAALQSVLTALRSQGIGIAIVTQRRNILKIATKVMMIENGEQVPIKVRQETGQQHPGVDIGDRRVEPDAGNIPGVVSPFAAPSRQSA